jgi:serine/threonine protein kinase
VLGTPGYMAPEQAAGLARTVGPSADVYALGALLVSVLTGRVLASGLDPAAQWATRQGGDGVPPPLRAIAQRCLESDPAQRYPDAGVLLDELRRYRSGDPVSAYREGVAERVIRLLRPWRTALVLLVAYLVMRMVVAWLGSGRFDPPGAP